MSVTQRPLQRETLALELTNVTLSVQRAQKVEEALQVGAAGLEALGFDVALVELVAGQYRLRYLSPRPELQHLASSLGTHLASFSAVSSDGLQSVMQTDQGLFIDQLPEATCAWLSMLGLPDTLQAEVRANVRQRAVVTPLSIRKEPWGGVIVMRDDLVPADQPLLSLFALQVGSWLGIVERLERLDQRTSELELVHSLAVSSTRSDVSELCRTALETVCRTSGSDAGSLHRFERETAEYVMVGDALGYRGPLSEQYRRFVMPPGVLTGPMMVPVAAMLEGSPIVAEAGFKYVALVPLSLEDTSVGLLSLFRREDRPYADSEVRSAEILGLQMASLLERQRLYLESQRLYADLKTSYDELERAQAELVRHERLAALGELAAVMAHEVRNPLGVIFNSLTTLKRLLKPAGDAEMLLTMVGEEAERLNRIVADLLDFARPYELVKKPIALEPFIASAIDAATQTLPGSLPLKVVTQFDKELPPFPVDAHLLRQALINLIVNAAQAMPRGGLVLVTARIEPKGTVPWLVLEVKDEGLGLTARATEKMFQPFFTTKATGTGLGLAVVKRIVDSHGGDVSARANGDRGTTFTIRLPGGSEREGGTTPPRPSPAVPRR
jgi:signal transduction histidine kinase